jgi:hypothetical protein
MTSTWRSGHGLPAVSEGNDGDYYLNLDSGDLFKRIAGVWSIVGNIDTPQTIGIPGAESVIYGHGAPQS